MTTALQRSDWLPFNWRKRSARIAPMSQAMPLPIAMPKTSFGAALSPDQLKQLAEIEVAQAGRIDSGDERLRRLTLADALNNLAEIKKLLLEYERRLLN